VLSSYSVITGQYEPLGVVTARVEDDGRGRWLQDGMRLASIWLQFGILSLSDPLQCLHRRQRRQRGLLCLWTSTLARRPLGGSKWSSSATSARSNTLRTIQRVLLWSDITQDRRELQTDVHWGAQVGLSRFRRATFLTHMCRVNGRPQGYKNATFHRYVSSHYDLFVSDNRF
jgi:hypothetical protein